jgi:hypothetical protein
VKRTLINVLKVGVSAGILGYLVHTAVGDRYFAQLAGGTKHWGLLAAAWSLLLVSVLITFLRWGILVRALGLPFGTRDALRLGFLGYLLNFVSLGSAGGDPFKAVAIAREQPGRRAEAVATVVVDRLVGLYGLFLVASAAVLATGLLRSEVAEVAIISRGTLVAAAVTTLAILIVLLPGFTTSPVWEMLGRAPRVGPILARLAEAVRVYRRRWDVMLVTLAMSVAVHCLNAAGVYLVARGLPGEAPSLQSHLLIVSLGMAAGALPLPLSGLGAFEGALEFLYRNLADVAVGANKGFVTALAYRVIQVAIAAVGAAYYLASRRDVQRMIHESEDLAAAEAPQPPLRGPSPQPAGQAR